jgi:hypothetical protein
MQPGCQDLYALSPLYTIYDDHEGIISEAPTISAEFLLDSKVFKKFCTRARLSSLLRLVTMKNPSADFPAIQEIWASQPFFTIM